MANIHNFIDRSKIQELAFFGILSFLLSFPSCKEKESSVQVIPDQSGYLHYGTWNELRPTMSFRTAWGEILQSEDLFFFVLSDTTHTTYEVVDTLFSSDQGKMRCTFNVSNLMYATAGSLTYDRKLGKAEFSIDINNSFHLEGKLIPDTILRHPILDFTQITMRDNNGMIQSTEDEGDWKIRNKWNPVETQLFQLKYNSTNHGGNFLIAYPNPMENSLNLKFISQQNKPLDFLLVNPNMEVERTFLNLNNTNMQLQIDNPAFNGGYYRLYYHYHPDSSYSIYGSGDIKFSE